MGACAFAAACSGGGAARPPATPARAANDPPAAYLRVGADQAVAGGLGSYCWKNVCKDIAGLLTSADPVEMQAGGPLAISYDPLRPADSEVEWHVAPEPAPKPESFGRPWTDSGPLAPGNAAVAPAKAGDYLLIVFGRWDREGDVTYSWYIRVK